MAQPRVANRHTLIVACWFLQDQTNGEDTQVATSQGQTQKISIKERGPIT